jgi:hypothetical protein
MSAFRRYPVLDPLDLEIIERAYEAAWARVETDLLRDSAKDDERKTALRHWAFVLAGSHPVDFDTLSTKLGTIIPKPWITPTKKVRAPLQQARTARFRSPLTSHHLEEAGRRAK